VKTHRVFAAMAGLLRSRALAGPGHRSDRAPGHGPTGTLYLPAWRWLRCSAQAAACCGTDHAIAAAWWKKVFCPGRLRWLVLGLWSWQVGCDKSGLAKQRDPVEPGNQYEAVNTEAYNNRASSYLRSGRYEKGPGGLRLALGGPPMLAARTPTTQVRLLQ